MPYIKGLDPPCGTSTIMSNYGDFLLMVESSGVSRIVIA
jgi:hypothetical protein